MFVLYSWCQSGVKVVLGKTMRIDEAPAVPLRRTIRFPRTIYQRIQHLARRHRRSTQAELLALLERVLALVEQEEAPLEKE